MKRWPDHRQPPWAFVGPQDPMESARLAPPPPLPPPPSPPPPACPRSRPVWKQVGLPQVCWEMGFNMLQAFPNNTKSQFDVCGNALLCPRGRLYGVLRMGRTDDEEGYPPLQLVESRHVRKAKLVRPVPGVSSGAPISSPKAKSPFWATWDGGGKTRGPLISPTNIP